MLTDTFTVRAFFIDFLSDPTRALRWDALRHDSGSPFEFVQLAKKAWAEVESGAGIKRDDERKVGEGKKCVFSDSLDTEAVRKIQQECDKAGIGGESTWCFGLPLLLGLRSTCGVLTSTSYSLSCSLRVCST